MDVQAYAVAVRVAMDDQISRVLMTVSEDVLKLHERFQQINKDLQGITASANKAATAFKNMTNAANGQFTGATRDAKAYADAMNQAARSTNAAAVASREAAKASTGMSTVPYLSLGYAAGAIRRGPISGNYLPGSASNSNTYAFGRVYDGSATRISGNLGNSPLGLPLMSSGGGLGNYGGGNSGGIASVGGNGGNSFGGLNGWVNGVPPGGWGTGGGNQPPGGNGGNRGGGHGHGMSAHEAGMTNMMTGYIGFEVLDKFTEEAAKYQTLTEKFKQFGMGDVALKDAEKFVAAQKIFGTSNTEMLADFIETQGVYRESGKRTLNEQLYAAKMISPMMAQLNVAMQGLDEGTRSASSAKKMDMLRFLETAGAAQSPARAKDLIEGSFKAIEASGGNIDFTQYRQFMAKAGTSAFGLTNLALFAELEPIIGEMKGSSAGDSFMTAYNRAHGILQPTHQATKEWLKLGLWDPNRVSFNSQGRVNIEGDPLKDPKLFDQSQVEFYLKDVLPRYHALNYSEEDIRRSNAILFGRTGGKMYNLIDKQQNMIQNGVAGYAGFRGLDDATQGVMGTYNGKGIDFQAKWANFELAIGRDGGLLDVFTSGLNSLTVTLQKLTDISNKYPALTKTVTDGALAIVGLAAVSGGFFMITQALKAVTVPLRLLTFGVASFPALATAMELLSGPVGWVIAAISGAVILYKNWDKIKPLMREAGKEMSWVAGQIWDRIKGVGTYIASWSLWSSVQTAFNRFSTAMSAWSDQVVAIVIKFLNKIPGVNINLGGPTPNPGGPRTTNVPTTAQQNMINSYLPGSDGMTFSQRMLKNAQNNNAAPVPGKSQQTIQVNSTINMDGKKVAQAVTTHQTTEASKPPIGVSAFDSSMLQLYSGMASAQFAGN